MKLIETISHLFHPRRSNNHRPRLLHPEALAFLPLIVIGFFIVVKSSGIVSQFTGSILGYASNITVDQVISFSNAERAKSGLSGLSYDSKLSAAAAGKASDMFINQYWAHTSPSGKEPWDFIQAAGYSYQVAGENLARDFSNTSDMTAAWMASPTHRANIMNSRYTHIGVAVVNGVLNGTETTLVVQMFGRPSSAGAQPQIAQQPSPPPVPIASPTLVEFEVVASPVPEERVAGFPIDQDQTSDEPSVTEDLPQPTVLANFFIPEGELLPNIVMSPLQITKAFFLAVLILLIAVLTYDLAIIGHRVSARSAGKNMAHIMLFVAVAILVIFFRGGVIG